VGRIQNNQSGFSAVEALLVLVILTLIGFVGFYVWHAKKTADKNLSTNHAASSTAKDKTAVTEPDGPYARWKEYCEDTTKGCFKYPSNWAKPAPNNSGLAFAQNPEETINAYAKVDNTDGPGDFMTTSVTPLSSSDIYSVVGGYEAISNRPGYYVVDSLLVSKYGLSVGKTSHLGAGQALYFTNSSSKFTFSASMNMQGGAASVDLSQTNAWLGSSDGDKAKLVAQSFNFK
jgi:Tfp pilus assembly protein PilX